MVHQGDRLPSPADYDPLFASAATLLPQLVEATLAERLRGAERVYENVYSGGRYEIRGGFGVVYLYRLRDATTIVALRVYATEWRVPHDAYEVGRRYDEMDRAFRAEPTLAAVTVPVRFSPEALRVPGWDRPLPLVLLDWAGPETLLDFVRAACTRPTAATRAALAVVARHWRDLLATLAAQQVEHGDLSPTNAIVRRADLGLTLIDYDFVWLHRLRDSNVSGVEAGQRLYSPPDIHRRIMLPSIPSSDPFAGLVIYTTLLALAERPELWHARRRQGGPLPAKAMLFTPDDLADPDTSWIFGAVALCAGREVRLALRALREACYRGVETLPDSLDGFLHWERRGEPSLEARIEKGWLRVEWSWQEGWGEHLVLLWRGDAPPKPGQMDRRWHLRRPVSGERRGKVEHRLASAVQSGHVALYRAPRETAQGAIAHAPDAQPVAAAEALVPRTVRCALLYAQGAAENILEIWSVDGRALPPLVVVRRIGARPDRVFGHMIVEQIATAEPFKRIALVPADRQNAFPPRSELRVFPARPEDRWRVKIETIGTGTEVRPLIKGCLLLN